MSTLSAYFFHSDSLFHCALDSFSTRESKSGQSSFRAHKKACKNHKSEQ